MRFVKSLRLWCLKKYETEDTPQHSLTDVREIAEHSRKRVIPQISKI